jgi:hypothetical protein
MFLPQRLCDKDTAMTLARTVLSTTIVILTACVSNAVPGDEPKATRLSTDDLSDWQTPTGEWLVAASVKLAPGNPKIFAIQPGKGILVNGADGKTTNILSRQQHGDVEAHIEFCVPQGSNSGVYFMGRYEIQVFDSWAVEKPKYSDCGGIYQRWKDNRGYEGHAPRINASKPPGQWQTFDVVFRAPRFDSSGRKTENARFVKVIHNGKVIHENVELTGPTRAATYEREKEAPRGPLMLQGDHGPVAYRNIRLSPK